MVEILISETKSKIKYTTWICFISLIEKLKENPSVQILERKLDLLAIRI